MIGEIELDLTDLKAIVSRGYRCVEETEHHRMEVKLTENAHRRLRDRWEATEGTRKVELYVCPFCETRVEAVGYNGAIQCRDCDEVLRRVEE